MDSPMTDLGHSFPSRILHTEETTSDRQVVGLQFVPTDKDLVMHYMKARSAGKLTEQEKLPIPDKDVFEIEP
eukprot:SM000264S09756  [mRNA]  locus=s264:98697:99415:+ [translate_table: standard]